MPPLLAPLRPLFLHAGLLGLGMNLLMLVPALYMVQVFDRVLTSRSDATLAVLTAGTIAALGILLWLDMLRGRLLASAGIAFELQTGPRVLTRTLSATASPGKDAPLYGLRDVATLRAFLSGQGITAMLDAPWLPVYLLVIWLFHPVLGAVAAAGAALLGLLAWINERATRTPLAALQARQRESGSFAESASRRAEVVAALGMGPALVRRWETLNRAALEAQASTSQTGGSLAGTGRILRQFVQITMLGAGAWLVIDQNASPGIMMAATVLLGRALAPVEGAIAGWKQFVDARNAHARLAELLVGEREVVDPTPLPAPTGAVSVERLVYVVPDAERPILRGVAFQVAAGESLAIIGPSGSGKSTLARLLLGIWPPNAGTVRLDGADLAHWPRDRLGPHLGYLPQNVQLFAGTVAENIARFQEGDPAAVIDAAQRAHVHDLILRLPRGYDTAIGDNGAGLSGGQAQRIALARALYGRPRIVVLDEPNANLDAEGEEALMRTMQTLKADGATLVVITHRPSLLAAVDRALVLRQGVIELQGTCAEVIGRLARESAPPDTPVVARLGAARAEG